MAHIKRSYHPYIPLLYNLGVLENEFTNQISTSTLHEWKNKDFDSTFGANQVAKHIPAFNLMDDYITKRKLAKIINATYRIYHIYSSFYNKKKLNDHK